MEGVVCGGEELEGNFMSDKVKTSKISGFYKLPIDERVHYV
jgi:hypothetical protein